MKHTSGRTAPRLPGGPRGPRLPGGTEGRPPGRKARPRARYDGGFGHRAGGLAPYAFVAPAVVLYVLVLLIPIGYTIYLSLEKTKVSGLGLGLGARRQVFAGLSNYTTALTDSPSFPRCCGS